MFLLFPSESHSGNIYCNLHGSTRQTHSSIKGLKYSNDECFICIYNEYNEYTMYTINYRYYLNL